MKGLRGKKSRNGRLTLRPGGVYVSASLEFLYLIKDQFRESARIAANPHGIDSVPLLVIPILLSCIRILALEIEQQKEGLWRGGYESGLLTSLEKLSGNDIRLILDFYGAPEELKTDMGYLIEIRHEILHPAPFPEPGRSLPDYLRVLEASTSPR